MEKQLILSSYLPNSVRNNINIYSIPSPVIVVQGEDNPCLGHIYQLTPSCLLFGVNIHSSYVLGSGQRNTVLIIPG